MATLTHIDPDFKSVFSIEATNEPLSNSDQTPGLKECALDSYNRFLVRFTVLLVYSHFSQVIRAVELSLGIRDKHTDTALVKIPALLNVNADGDLLTSFKLFSSNNDIDWPVRKAFQDSSKILTGLTSDRKMNIALQYEPLVRSALTVKYVNLHNLPSFKITATRSYMDYQWQHNKGKANGADVALGNQIFDDHHYFVFGVRAFIHSLDHHTDP
jgi:hypothetical protein